MKHHEEHHDEKRHRRETGGFNAPKEDLEKKTEMRVHAPKIEAEANERKSGGKAEHKHEPVRHHEECKCRRCMGGRAAKRRGGSMSHKEGFGPENEATKEMAGMAHGGHAKKEPAHHKAKHVGHVDGEHAKHRADRKPRKAGGRTGADAHPFSSARHGSPAPGRKVEMEME